MNNGLQLYGIPNCDSVKKARLWLQARGLAHDFIDFKKTPPSAELLAHWLQQLDWQVLLNRQGTTWRKLSEAQQSSAVDAASAAALMQAEPSLIKRPVIQWPSSLTAGFKPEQWPI